MKRALDYSLAITAIILSLPILVIIAILIRFDSAGPILFTQTRVGYGGKQFTLIKFRTMHTNHDQEQDVAFLKDFVEGKTPRVQESGKQINKPFSNNEVTTIGHFLRKTSLDELPQLFNVIKGEMSLVGPRPNLPVEVEAYKPWHRERLEVYPGITGLAQVNGRSELNFDEIVKYDVEYVRRASFALDLRLIWQTVIIVLSGKGAA